MMLTDKLLKEFPPVSREAWDDAIRADLGTADYEKALVWQTREGMAVKPYYRAEDLDELIPCDGGGDHSTSLPHPRMTGHWRIREEIHDADPKEANRMAREAIASGVEEIVFRNVVLKSASDLTNCCANLQPIPLHFEDASESLLNLLIQAQDPLAQSPVSTGWNPLGNLDFAATVHRAGHSGLVPFTIHAEELQERGASTVEELGYTLAAGIEFIRAMQERDIAIDLAASSLVFSFSIGASYVFQIAKFRAFRSLWAKAVSCFPSDCGMAEARIYARTSRWNKTIYDPHNNILRATTEVMSAALGGANSICVAPFDECFKIPGEASRRLARNTQLILKHEAMLGRVADPAAGSYCIEIITDFLARESWQFMQKIEAAGGYTNACKNQHLDNLLRDSEVRQENAVTSLQRILTGTNKYANAAERALEQIESLHVLDDRRGAAAFEVLRLRTEKYVAETGRVPHILLAEFGDTRMRQIRSRFASNFLACAGFCAEARSFTSVGDIADAHADAIVLCSSDLEYLDMATDLMSRMKEAGRKTAVMIAGKPESAEKLRAEGIADFIHIRTNPVGALTDLQVRLGIMV